MKNSFGLSGVLVLVFCIFSTLPLVAQRGDDSPVREYGKLESGKRLTVKAPFDSQILYLAAEGTVVTKGDLIVEYDRSKFDAEFDALKIQLKVQESAIQSETAALGRLKSGAEQKIGLFQARLADAEKSLEEYANEKEGEAASIARSMEIEFELCQNKILFAQSELKNIDLSAKSDLHQAELTIQKAELEMALTKAQLDRFKLFESPRHLRQLSNSVLEAKIALKEIEMDNAAEIAKSEEKLIQLKSRHQIEKEKRSRLENQISQSRYVADIDGIVMHVTVGSRTPSIKAGATVRARQNILMIADPTKLQMAVLVNETRVRRLKPGQAAQVRLDAGGPILMGTVSKISTTPEPVSFLGGDVTKYRVEVLLKNVSRGHRIGMTGMAEFKPFERSK